MNRRNFLLAAGSASVGVVGASTVWYLQQQRIGGEMTVKPLQVKDREIWVYATVNGRLFDNPDRHGVVFEWGKNGNKCVLKAKANPKDFYYSLINLGAVPGNNVKMDSPAGTLVEGTVIDVYVTWNGAPRRYKFSEVINDPQGKEMVVKFGGNLSASDEYMTGCILCLDTCAVGITSNSAYGWKSGLTFTGRKEILPPDGTPVLVIFAPRL